MKTLDTLSVGDFVYLVQLDVVSRVTGIGSSLTGRIRVDTAEVAGANQQEFALITGIKASLLTGTKEVKDEYEEWHVVADDVFIEVVKWWESINEA